MIACASGFRFANAYGIDSQNHLLGSPWLPFQQPFRAHFRATPPKPSRPLPMISGAVCSFRHERMVGNNNIVPSETGPASGSRPRTTTTGLPEERSPAYY